VLNLKRTGTSLGEFDGERARPSWRYWLRAELGRERLIDGKLATSEKDLQPWLAQEKDAEI
jgi:hypothetical protein